MQPIPNLATESTPAAFVFGYMFPNAQQDHIIKRYWPEGSYKDVQPVGPSPVLIHREQLRKIYRKWLDFSLGLRSNGDAEKVIQGWVQEMWGYSIAAASVGVKHRLVEEFQVEPGALSTADQLKDFGKRHYIFHYTYQFEYMLDGTPCQPWNIGEYSLDKRHFNDLSPAYPLPPPPEKANAAAFWLHNAWNEAMGAAGEGWTQAPGSAVPASPRPLRAPQAAWATDRGAATLSAAPRWPRHAPGLARAKERRVAAAGAPSRAIFFVGASARHRKLPR